MKAAALSTPAFEQRPVREAGLTLLHAVASQLRLHPGRGGGAEFSAIGSPKAVADYSLKFLVRASDGVPVAVVKYSPAMSPDAAAEEADRLGQVRAALPPVLAGVLPEVLSIGVADGRSYLVLRHYRTLADNRWRWAIQRLALRPRVLDWLRQVTAATARDAAADEVDACFAAPLRFVAGHALLADEIRRSAEAALARLFAESWRPRLVLLHNDLWRGNLLLPDRGSPGCHWGFVLIDWLGARVGGQGVYDLLRLGRSLGLGRPAFRRELAAHCAALGCGPADAEGHLLACLGHLGMHPGAFPEARYLNLVRRCHRELRDLLA